MMQRIQLAFFVPFFVANFVTPTALPARSLAGSLMGDVFVTMKGDVKRAAGVEVLIVSAATQFDQEWERLQNEYPVDRQIEDTRRRLTLSQQSAELVGHMMRLGRVR